ncbi:hypothetical protein CANINC_001879 [Pichia inconspicua]|uniref:PCI domain-containing protein n=1 Tax=Pichia inconspicua TaxID=52247 RepID=A0A4T0X364_9ASCO|nr:hypothetical protein CANINC_001879 [[Candida] inconspicua]
MPFTIVNENDLKSSVIELAAILDLEIKAESPEHQYKTVFKQLLDDNETETLTKQLIEVQPLFASKLSRKSFEPTINLYIHISQLLDNQKLLNTLISNIYPTDSHLPVEVILIVLTNIFNALPKTSIDRLESLKLIVEIISKEQIAGLIANIAKNVEDWLSTIEQISSEQTSDLISSIFLQYAIEDESNAVKFLKGLIINNKLNLNAGALVSFYTAVLSSENIYELSDLNNFDDVENATLTKLLELYVKGDYSAFVTNKSQFESIPNINLSHTESSLQSLAILNLLAKSTAASVSYQNISDNLNIPVEDIELKVITLISEGFISAKLSQPTNSVIVNAVNFNAPSLSTKAELLNWSEIHTLLESWNENIEDLQTVVQGLIAKRGKRVNAPAVIMNFHQQKLEAKEAREKKAQQAQDVEVDA